ncbi:MAG: hypothetical protein M3P27_10245 [Acidobacteriota bacterium]|nr:hypothetical protein [Acidobacteriota bacterium]
MFIDEWFGKDFYSQLPLGHHNPNNFVFGQFFKTHAYYPHENLDLWRPVPEANEPTKTIASKFQQSRAGKDAFRRGTPLQVPKLETNEEFIVVRAKVRPVMLIQPELEIGFDNRGYRGRVHRRRCLVAQIFGLADTKTGQAEFSPEFVRRVRKVEYPQLLFLPKKAGLLDVDSILRLDELQSVFTPHLESLAFSVGAEVQSMLKDQLAFLITAKGPNTYTELREEILGSPD